MHQIIYSIRQIPADQLPTVQIEPHLPDRRPATDADLLNLGMHHLHDDLYSCAEHLTSEVVTDELTGKRARVYSPLNGVAHPGERITAGMVFERYANLPADVRPKVLRADAFRATDPAGSALEIVATNLNEQVSAIEESVGATDPPLFDPTTDAAAIAEAERVAASPTPELTRVVVPMITIDPSADLVVKDSLIPHAWAGEQ